jgi:hypothetical protein
LSEQDTYRSSPDRPPDGGFEDLAARRRRLRVPLAVLLALVVVGLLVVAFTPRTVSSGGEGDAAWSVRVTPGILSPTVRIDSEGDEVVLEDTGATAELTDTAILQAPADDPVVTVVVGPTPRGVDSVRVTSLERGVGEAAIERVAWRRVHLTVLTGDVWVTDLVAIAGSGRVLETVEDLPPPASTGDGSDPGSEADADG